MLNTSTPAGDRIWRLLISIVLLFGLLSGILLVPLISTVSHDATALKEFAGRYLVVTTVCLLVATGLGLVTLILGVVTYLFARDGIARRQRIIGIGIVLLGGFILFILLSLSGPGLGAITYYSSH